MKKIVEVKFFGTPTFCKCHGEPVVLSEYDFNVVLCPVTKTTCDTFTPYFIRKVELEFSAGENGKSVEVQHYKE